MIVFAPAKINIGLYVTEKRDDGYHNIESVLYPVPLEDVLEIIPSDSFQIIEYGLSSMCKPEANLCTIAWKLLSEQFSIPAVKINLLKNIPVQAGLGGGSSDAVALLKGLDRMFEIGLSSKDLHGFAFQIGSDCPFFVDELPVYASSRGEIMQTVNLSLKGMWLLIIKPPFGMSTSRAFAEIVPAAHGLLMRDVLQEVHMWRNSISNVFEQAFYKLFPEVRKVTDGIAKQNPLFFSLSGSGSSFFALHDKPMNTSGIPPEWYVVQMELKK
jgi:4-diphosphocytidyl-2-C-methyl-D-erythritol kinase